MIDTIHCYDQALTLLIFKCSNDPDNIIFPTKWIMTHFCACHENMCRKRFFWWACRQLLCSSSRLMYSKACTAFTHSLLCLCSIWLRSSCKKATSVVRLYLRRMGGMTDWASEKGRILSGQLGMPLVSCDNQLTTDSTWIAHTSASFCDRKFWSFVSYSIPSIAFVYQADLKSRRTGTKIHSFRFQTFRFDLFIQVLPKISWALSMFGVKTNIMGVIDVRSWPCQSPSAVKLQQVHFDQWPKRSLVSFLTMTRSQKPPRKEREILFTCIHWIIKIFDTFRNWRETVHN